MGELFVTLLLLAVATIVIVALRGHRTPRTVVVLLAAFVLGFAVIVVLPFYAYGMHLQDPVQVAGGAFDPRGFPLFSSESVVGNIMHFAALLLFPLTPIAIIALGLRSLVSLWQRRVAARSWQALAASLVVVSVLLFAYLWTPAGKVLLAWHFD
jgi:hypothetical protein